MAVMVASVPELTIRTISIDGTISQTNSAKSISEGVGAPKLKPFSAAFNTASKIAGWLWPKIIGPQEPT